MQVPIKTRGRLWGAISLLVFGLLAGGGMQAGAEEPDPAVFTLGDFYFECVRAFKIEFPEGWDKSKAWLLLRATGLEVDGKQDFSRPARQKDVIHIARQLGISLSTKDETQPVTRKQVEAFLTRFQDYFRLPLRLPPQESRDEGGPTTTNPSPPSSDNPQN
jgi:hypothetical protein